MLRDSVQRCQALYVTRVLVSPLCIDIIRGQSVEELYQFSWLALRQQCDFLLKTLYLGASLEPLIRKTCCRLWVANDRVVEEKINIRFDVSGFRNKVFQKRLRCSFFVTMQIELFPCTSMPRKGKDSLLTEPVFKIDDAQANEADCERVVSFSVHFNGANSATL